MIQTRKSLVGKLFDKLRLNERFHKYETIYFNKNSKVISPVEATVAFLGDIDDAGNIISKNNKKISLYDVMGKQANNFLNGNYINLYLSPLNKHFWVTPAEGKFIYTQKNEGKAKIPIFLGLENILGIEMFSKAVEKNASIASIFQTKKYKIAMIAVGSLNVNGITVDYEDFKNYSKGTPCGYFNLGSSMLLCFENKKKYSFKIGDKVEIGDNLCL